MYVQSESIVQYLSCFWPTASLKLHSHTLLRVDRPLYRLPEAGVYWFWTHHNDHRVVLELRPFILKPCYLYMTQEFLDNFMNTAISFRFTCIKTNGTTNVGSLRFGHVETSKSKKFYCKAPIFWTQSYPIQFDGATITTLDGFYFFLQLFHLSKRRSIFFKKILTKMFTFARVREKYVLQQFVNQI